MNVVNPATWTSFCLNAKIQEAAKAYPIFLFDRMTRYPIFNAALLQHLKDAKVSGLVEGTEYNKTEPHRPASYHGYETIFPLDPAYRR